MSAEDLPPGWVETSLGAAGSWTGGGTPSKSEASFWTGGSIPWVSPKDMKTKELWGAEDMITAAALGASATNLIAVNSVLVVTRSGILQRTVPVAVNRVPVAINQDIKALTPNKAVLPEFVASLVESREQAILADCSKSGTTVASIDTVKLTSFYLPLPPLNEQRRIVAKLDELRGRSRKAREALDVVPALLDKLKQSVLAAAFRGDLTAEWRAAQPPGSVEPASVLLDRIRAERRQRWEQANPKKKYVEPAPVDADGLPDLPDGWCWARLEELIWDGPSNGYSGPTEGDSLGTLTLKLSATTSGEFLINDKTTKRLTETIRLDSDLWLRAGDVLVQRANTIDLVGTAAVFPGHQEPVVYPDLMMRLRPALPALSNWMWRCLNSPGCRSWLRTRATGTAGNMPKINGSTLRNTPIPIPTVGEMEEVNRVVQAVMASFEAFSATHLEVTANVSQLDQSILAKAFRGELVPQDPNDEPAEQLLARIQAEAGDRAPRKKGGRGRKATGTPA